MLAKIPSLVFYPEQYKSGLGGCIDGHVKHANPPLGKTDMPIWFNTTLAREYVYNSAVKTKSGYRFWDTYGFMHSDHSEEMEDYFIKNWKYVLRHKPKKLARAPIFIAEFPREESLYESEFSTTSNWHVYYNRSEEGIAHVYETMRMNGIPMGSYAVWDTLDDITAEDTDLLVIPSTVGLSKEKTEKLRALHRDGVSLFAVSRVDGLEDLFGVRYSPKTARVHTVSDGTRTEDIYPYTETFDYVSDGAQTLLFAEGNPVIMKNGKCALINTSAYSIGRIHFNDHPYLGRATCSKLYREITENAVRDLVSPLATADKECGITLAADESGNEMLIAIDYSRYDGSEINKSRDYTVWFSEGYSDAQAIDNKPIRRLIREDGVLEGIVVSLRQHESALIKLIR